MKFKQFLQESEGVYVGARFDESSIENLKSLQRVLGINNPVSDSDFHVTVLYSRNPIKVEPKEYTFVAKAICVESWEQRNGKWATVVKLECPELSQRHQELIEQGGTHDFDDYQVHVTLSYDHRLTVDNIELDGRSLNIVGEYVEPLDLNWSDNK